MKKKLVWWSGMVLSILLLASCMGGNKKTTEVTYSKTEIENANSVIKYYDTALKLLKNMVKEKDINAVLGYMEQQGKVPSIPAITPPAVSEKELSVLMNPGGYFNAETQQNLKKNFSGLFSARSKFYANFDQYLSDIKSKNNSQAKGLLDTGYQLSTEMSEYKQNIFDILSPFTEEAQKIILVDNPLKEQMVAMRKMELNMQSIVSLYGRKHAMDGTRIDLKTAELTHEWEAAKKLPVVTGYDAEMKSFQKFLNQVGDFINQVHKVRQKAIFSDADYDMLSSAYETSII